MRLIIVLVLPFFGTSCANYWTVTELGRDREDPNEILGVSVGVPVVPLQVRASLERTF